MSSTVAVMGTCVGGDLVKYTKAVNGYRIVKNIVSINPISMYYNYLSRISRNDLDIYNDDIFCDSWHEKNIRSELNGTCFSELEMLKPDIVLVDLLDIRIDVVELSFENGCKIYYTKTQHSDLLKAKIIEAASHYFGCGLKLERVIKCMSWPDDKLKEFLNDYINILRKYFGNKLIIFKPKLANQYIDKNEIKFTENFHICGNINKFCDRLYNCISKGFSYIDAPKNIIGDASFLAPFEYHYCEPYYNYLEQAINIYREHFDYDSKISDLLVKCEKEIHELYYDVMCESLLNRISNRVDYLGSNIVLIGKSDVFIKKYKAKTQKDIVKWIYYDEYTDCNNLETEIKNTISSYKNILFCLPEVFHNGGHDNNIYLTFHKLHLIMDRHYITAMHRPIVLNNYSGWYEDIYDNIAYFGNALPSVKLNGNGIRINVEKGTIHCNVIIYTCGELVVGKNCSRSDLCLFTVLFGGLLKLGDRVDFGVHGNLRCGHFDKLIIGNDCMFSDYVIIRTSDGHAIFDTTKEHIKDLRLNPHESLETIIGDHVWGGYQSIIMNKAHIGSGSIVGAYTVANKKYPNNCIIAGVPGRVIKRNRAWTRNDLFSFLTDDINIYENYADITDDNYWDKK